VLEVTGAISFALAVAVFMRVVPAGTFAPTSNSKRAELPGANGDVAVKVTVPPEKEAVNLGGGLAPAKTLPGGIVSLTSLCTKD
jgi:hypothetical protein